MLNLKNYKLLEQYDMVAQILANMVEAHNAGKVLADNRNSGGKTHKRIKLYNALLKAEVIKICLGSERSKKVSRYTFTPKGVKIFGSLNTVDVTFLEPDQPITENRVNYNSNRAPVILRIKKNGEKIPIQFPRRMDLQILDFITWLEKTIMKINSFNLSHEWKYYILNEKNQFIGENQVNPCVRSIFIGDFTNGGRLYTRGASGYQSLSKAERRTLLVNGKSVAEVDFSGCQIRMLYHMEEIDYKGDVYQPEKLLPELYASKLPEKYKIVARDYIKAVTNIIINAESYEKAKKAASKKYRDTNDGLLSKVIYGICKIKPTTLIDRITQLHEPISKYFFSGIGSSLQNKDMRIIIQVLNSFIDEKCPALSLHDAVICRKEDALLGRRLMEEFYIQEFKFKPVIKTEE